MYKLTLGFWIYAVVCLPVTVYGLTCSCGNIEEGETVRCQCDTDNPIQWWFKGDIELTTCDGALCFPSSVAGYTFTHTGSTYQITISTFSFTDCKGYANMDFTTLEITIFPYCPGLTCTCGNIEEGEGVECQCDTVNPIQWYKGDSELTRCNGATCGRPDPPPGYTFSHSGLTYKIAILTFSFTDCKAYAAKDLTTQEAVYFPYCSVLTMTKPTSDGTINIEENTPVEFICKMTSGPPAGSVEWYVDVGTSGNIADDVKITAGITSSSDISPTDNQEYIATSTLILSPPRSYSGYRIYCKATNKPEQTPLYSQKKPRLNIIYYSDGPTITEGSSYRVIETTTGQLSCVATGGNPSPTVTWNCNGGSQNSETTGDSKTNTVTWTAGKGDSNTCICTSSQTGLQSIAVSTQISVLYPPSAPIFKISGQTIIGDIKLIENTSSQIRCVSTGSPNPTIVWEKLAGSSASSSGRDLSFTSVSKTTDGGTYTCRASNVMDQTGVPTQPETRSSSRDILVLYPPVVEQMPDLSRVKGSTLTVDCNVTEGFPAATSTQWKTDVDYKTWSNKPLYIQSIRKSDAGRYTCVASNTMRPSGDTQSYPGRDEKHFDLTVLYEASVTSFYVDGYENDAEVTVSEGDSVMFKCSVDSNPTATITLKKSSKPLQSDTSNILYYHLPRVSCLDAGTYSCAASNVHNDQISMETVKLFVNCLPRSAVAVEQNRTSEKNETFTFTFDAIAYPVPVYKWKKWIDDDWKLLQNGDNVQMTSSGLQSNLTIHRMRQSDFGQYLLVVTNDVGEFDQLYQLAPYDAPDVPTEFRHLETQATESTLQLEWKPGNDGGLPQTFYIKYKTRSSHTWRYIDVSDTGEQIMRYQLTGLKSDTTYKLIIYSSNRYGNSSESAIVTATTKGKDEESNIGGLIGGLVGSVFGIAVIVVLVIIVLRRHRLMTGSKTHDTELRDRNQPEANKPSEDVSYYNIGRDNEMEGDSNNATTDKRDGSGLEYESLSSQNREVTTYSTLQPVHSSPTNVVTSDDNKTYENLKLHVI